LERTFNEELRNLASHPVEALEDGLGGGDLVQGGEGRRSFIGFEEGDEFGGEAERAGEGGGLGVRKCGYLLNLTCGISVC
jgi:hypothetical protein